MGEWECWDEHPPEPIAREGGHPVFTPEQIADFRREFIAGFEQQIPLLRTVIHSEAKII